MKVLFLTNVPSPYRVDFFNELGKLCNLTVLFEKRTSTERDKSWQNYKFENFKGVFLKGISLKTDMAWSFGVKKYLKDKSFDVIVCTNYVSPTGMFAIRYMRHNKIKYFIEGDGGFSKSGKGFKEAIKRYFLKGAAGYLSTAKEHDKYYITYGAEENKIFRYPFTSLFDKDILEKTLTLQEKVALRNELGLIESKVVISVGQFIYRKGFDILINAAKSFDKDIGFYIVGGKPTDEYIGLKNKLNLSNVHFVDFKSKEELKKYYQAADVFVLPTREDIWGLVINEAMANGLPVVSTDRCVAATELVKDGVNGYVVPVDNVSALSQAIEKIFDDYDTQVKMGNNSLEIIRNYTFEQMAKRHIEILEKFL